MEKYLNENKNVRMGRISISETTIVTINFWRKDFELETKPTFSTGEGKHTYSFVIELLVLFFNITLRVK